MKKIIFIFLLPFHLVSHPLEAILQKLYYNQRLWNTALVFAQNPHICFPLLKILNALSTQEQERILFWLRHRAFPQSNLDTIYRQGGLEKFKIFISKLVAEHEENYIMHQKENPYLKQLLEYIGQNNKDTEELLIALIGECRDTQEMLIMLDTLKNSDFIGEKLHQLYISHNGDIKKLYQYLHNISAKKDSTT